MRPAKPEDWGVVRIEAPRFVAAVLVTPVTVHADWYRGRKVHYAAPILAKWTGRTWLDLRAYAHARGWRFQGWADPLKGQRPLATD